MTWHRYERPEGVLESGDPLSPEEVDAYFADLRARRARRAALPPAPYMPPDQLEDLLERFGGPVFEPLKPRS